MMVMGFRWLATVSGVTTSIGGGIYEVNDTDITKYYGGKTAMRVNGTFDTICCRITLEVPLWWTDSLGNVVYQSKGTKPGVKHGIAHSAANTGFTCTPDREQVATILVLYFYKARWYDSSLGNSTRLIRLYPVRGIHAHGIDTSYVKNSPVVYNDPSGHLGCWDDNSDDSFCEGKTVNKNGIVNKPIMIISCGMGTNGNCKKGEPVLGYGSKPEVPLAPYRDWGYRNGFNVQYFDLDDYENKNSLSSAILALMSENSKMEYLLVGHSAGANSVILAISQAQDYIINGVILLDPTLSAGPNYMTTGSMAPLLVGIKSAKIPLHIGDTIQGSNNDISSDYIDLLDYVSELRVTITQYSNISHLYLANNPGVFEDSISGIYP